MFEVGSGNPQANPARSELAQMDLSERAAVRPFHTIVAIARCAQCNPSWMDIKQQDKGRFGPRSSGMCSR